MAKAYENAAQAFLKETNVSRIIQISIFPQNSNKKSSKYDNINTTHTLSTNGITHTQEGLTVPTVRKVQGWRRITLNRP